MVLEAAYDLKPLMKLKDISYEWLLDIIKIGTLFMSEPENAAVVTVALAGAYCAYRMFHSPNAKRFPDFPGREFLSGHGPMIDSSESESEATVSRVCSDVLDEVSSSVRFETLERCFCYKWRSL